MVSPITGWKLFTEENHITEDCLFIYALSIFKCVHCLKKLEVELEVKSDFCVKIEIL